MAKNPYFVIRVRNPKFNVSSAAILNKPPFANVGFPVSDGDGHS